jgi:hypothetical protein
MQKMNPNPNWNHQHGSTKNTYQRRPEAGAQLAGLAPNWFTETRAAAQLRGGARRV